MKAIYAEDMMKEYTEMYNSWVSEYCYLKGLDPYESFPELINRIRMTQCLMLLWTDIYYRGLK